MHATREPERIGGPEQQERQEGDHAAATRDRRWRFSPGFQHEQDAEHERVGAKQVGPQPGITVDVEVGDVLVAEYRGRERRHLDRGLGAELMPEAVHPVEKATSENRPK